MDAVTYPQAQVVDELNKHFVPVHFNAAEAGPRITELARQFRQVWTPTFVFLDPHGIELRRFVGYMPPEEFLAELGFVRGYAALFRGDTAAAFQILRTVVEQHPGAAVAPEALYWAGVAAYRRDGKPDELRRQWAELQERYPHSIWWKRASFIAG